MQYDGETIQTIIAPHIGAVGGVISALRAIQSQLGFLPDAIDALIADGFNISRAEVKGVISFYSDFTRTPKEKVVIRVCAAEACQAAGGRELMAATKAEFCPAQENSGAITKDAVGVESVFCLGLCSVAPAAIVGTRLVGKATTARLHGAVQSCLKDESV